MKQEIEQAVDQMTEEDPELPPSFDQLDLGPDSSEADAEVIGDLAADAEYKLDIVVDGKTVGFRYSQRYLDKVVAFGLSYSTHRPARGGLGSAILSPLEARNMITAALGETQRAGLTFLDALSER